MSSHPNVILMVVFEPNEDPKETWEKIIKDASVSVAWTGEDYIKQFIINDKIHDFDLHFLEDEIEYESYQICVDKENSIIAHDFITYGYGENISWKDLESIRICLYRWAIDISEKYNCNFDIKVTANYW